MALAFLVAAIASFLDARKWARESRPPPGWLLSRLFFYLTVLVAIPFFANWFASLGHTDDGILWIYVETARAADLEYPGRPALAWRKDNPQGHSLTHRFGRCPSQSYSTVTRGVVGRA